MCTNYANYNYANYPVPQYHNITRCCIVGTSLLSVLESSELRVVVAISADLAHTHDSSGPYGYSNASQPFDDVS